MTSQFATIHRNNRTTVITESDMTIEEEEEEEEAERQLRTLMNGCLTGFYDMQGIEFDTLLDALLMYPSLWNVCDGFRIGTLTALSTFLEFGLRNRDDRAGRTGHISGFVSFITQCLENKKKKKNGGQMEAEFDRALAEDAEYFEECFADFFEKETMEIYGRFFILLLRGVTPGSPGRRAFYKVLVDKLFHVSHIKDGFTFYIHGEESFAFVQQAMAMAKKCDLSKGHMARVSQWLSALHTQRYRAIENIETTPPFEDASVQHWPDFYASIRAIAEPLGE